MQLKRIILVLGLFAAAVGGIWWYRSIWPLGTLETRMEVGQDVRLDSELTVRLHTNQDFERTSRLGVTATVGGFVLGASPSLLENENGKATLVLQMTPHAVVFEEPLRGTFTANGAVAGTCATKVTVPMPQFYATGEQSFLEMVSAPSSSIYGSHITRWNPLGKTELFLVTGHAASSVCRVASAALFGLAYETDIASPYFMLGAGIGCIDTTGLRKEIERQRVQFLIDYPEIAEKCKTAIGEDGIVKTARFRGFDEAELLSIRRMDWLERLDDAAVQDVNRDKKTDREVLAPIAAALEELGDGKPNSAQLAVVKRLLEDPRLAEAALCWTEVEEMEDTLAILRTWAREKRSAFEDALRRLIEKDKALATAGAGFAGLEERTGLVFSRHSSVERCADADTVAAGVADWVKRAPSVASIELPALAHGHDGTVLLPFFDAEGKAVEFTLDEALLGGETSQDWRRVMQATTTVELAAAAKAIHERVKERLDDGAEQVARVTKRARAVRDLGAWLEERERVMVNECDPKGRIVGSHEEWQSNLELVLGSWQFAASYRKTENFYGRLVQSTERMTHDPRFRTISDACLLDSLLRGWKLAFSDDETESRFETWSSVTRSAVWAHLWKQATARGLDLRDLIGEGTVFQVVPQGKEFLVRPRFVAEIARTRCVRHRTSGMVAYTSAWMERCPVGYRVAPGTAPASPAAASDRIFAQVSAACDASAEAIQKEPPGRRWTRLVEERARFRSAFSDSVRTALCASPERTVAGLVQRLLDPWPIVAETSLSAAEQSLCDRAYEWDDFDGDVEDRWKHFSPQLLDGSWPFADEYKHFVEFWRKKAASTSDAHEKRSNHELADKLFAAGTRIDGAFMADATAGSTPQRSKIRIALQARDGDRVIDALHLVSLLAEAERAFDGWEEASRLHFMLEELADRLRGLPDALRSPLDDQLTVLAVSTDSTSLGELANVLSRVRERLRSASAEYARADASIERHVANLEECLRRQDISLGADTAAASKPRVLSALHACLERMPKTGGAAWAKEVVNVQQGELEQLVEQIEADTDYDAVNRSQYRQQVAEIRWAIADVTLRQIRRIHDMEPSRRTLEMRVQAEWAMGLYEEALRTLMNESLARVGLGFDDRNARRVVETANDGALITALRADLWAQLASESELDLLKACVYSGGEFFGTSIFGRRPNDWVRKPAKVEDIVVGFEPASEYGLSRVEGEALGEAYAKVVRGKDTISSIGRFKKVTPIAASFTEVRVFRVEDQWGNPSIVKVMPKDAAGLNKKQMEAAVRMTDYLARKGASVPSMLPMSAEDGAKVLETTDCVMTRETLAAGRELADVVKSEGRWTAETEHLYIRSTLDTAIRGMEMPAGIGFKAPLTDFASIRDKLLERGVESRRHFQLFADTHGYQARYGEAASTDGTAFDRCYRKFVGALWPGDQLLQEKGLVHDAIARNYFLDGKDITLIDFGSDYVGSIGNLMSTMLTQLFVNEVPTYQQYVARFEGLMAEYQIRIGRQLTDEQVLEVIQHLSIQPYKMLSSDSGQFLAGLTRSLGVSPEATEEDVASALRQNLERVDEFLANPVHQQKYDQYLQLMVHSLELLRERLPKDDAKRRAATDAFLEQVRHIRELKMRVVLAKTRGLRAA